MRDRWGTLRRGLGWSAIVLGGTWLFVWLTVPLTASSAPDRCQRVPGMVRGASHIHPISHDGVDRSEQVLAAAEASCFDFAVITDHEAQRARIFDLAAPLLLLDGAEWNVDGHHHTQFVNAIMTVDAGNTSRFRVLNHPVWSGVLDPDGLHDDEKALLAQGHLGFEVLNTPRLARRPRHITTLVKAVLIGPARADLVVNALMEPPGSHRLWLEVQRELGQSVPMSCGNDAHGRWMGYDDLFPSAVLYLPAPEDTPLDADWIVDSIRGQRAFCVNEYLGSPGPMQLSELDTCEVRVDVSLPDGEWRLMHGDDVVESGTGPATVRVPAGVVHVEAWREADFGVLGSEPRLWVLGRAFVFPERCGP